MTVDLAAYKKLYLTTAQELLTELADGVADLRNGEQAKIAATHRAAHSFKSQSLVMGYTQLGLAGRILEALFLRIKNHEIQPTENLLQTVQHMLKRMQESLQAIQQNQGEVNLSPDMTAIETQASVTLLD